MNTISTGGAKGTAVRVDNFQCAKSQEIKAHIETLLASGFELIEMMPFVHYGPSVGDRDGRQAMVQIYMLKRESGEPRIRST